MTQNNEEIPDEIIYDKKAKYIAKFLSLIAITFVLFSYIHRALDWTLLEANYASQVGKTGLVLMIIALAFNGKATTKEVKDSEE